MRHGDWIKFVIAVDRRDKLRRATKIELLDESFQVSDERREQGTVHSLRYELNSAIFKANWGNPFTHFLPSKTIYFGYVSSI